MTEPHKASIFKIDKKILCRDRSRQYIEKVDAFGQPVQLLCKKNDQHQTIFGGCFSIAIVFFTTYYFAQLVVSLVNSSDPTTVYTEIFVQQPEAYSLSPDQFSVAFGVMNAYDKYIIDESIAFIQVLSCIQIKQNGIFEVKCTQVPLEICNISTHFKIPELLPFFKNNQLSKFKCIAENFWNNNTLEIEGYNGESRRQWLNIDIYQCQNQTGNDEVYFNTPGVVCQPQEVIDRNLLGGYLRMFYSDSVIDAQTQGNPFTWIGRNVFLSFTNQMYSWAEMYFRHTYLESDDGWVNQETTIYHNLQYIKSENSFLLIKQQAVFTLLIKLDQIGAVTYRSYSKILDIMGQVGGLWQALSMFGYIVVVPFNKLDLQTKIVNEIFTFEKHSEIKETQVVPEKNIFTGQQVDNLNPPENVLRSLSQRLKTYRTLKSGVQNVLMTDARKSQSNQINIFRQYLKGNLNRMSLSALDYLTYYLGCFVQVKKKKAQMDFGFSRIEKQADILYIMKKLNELEKLKCILLTKPQLQLFDYLPKPCIPLNPKGDDMEQKFANMMGTQNDIHLQYWLSLQSYKTAEQRAYEAFDAYEQLIRHQHLSEIDIKLINCLDSRIKQLFELGREGRVEEVPKVQEKQSVNRSLDEIAQIYEDQEIFPVRDRANG